MNEKRKLIGVLIFPVSFVLALWIVKIIESIFNIDFAYLGVYPLKISGLIGIITAPLIHSDYSHLTANTIPALVLTGLLFYLYRGIAFKIFTLIYIISNIWLWTFAREAYHIGASGVIYGLAAFLAFSGFLRKHIQLSAVSLLIIFLYGGIIWGVFPYFLKEKNISWEAHLCGLLSGLILAFFFKREGPQRKRYDWEFDIDEDENENNDPQFNN